MEDALVEGLEDLTDEAAEELAHQWREKAMRRLDGASPGEALQEYFTEVERVDGGYEWRVKHPVAEQHEMGGHVYSTYGTAKLLGWTRDEIYHPLEDCQTLVEPKRYARNTAHELRGEHR